MQQLAGTESQIEQASHIRDQKIVEANDYIRRYEAGEIETGDESEADRPIKVAEMKTERDRVLSHPEAGSATFWIANEDTPGVALLCAPSCIFFNRKFTEDHTVHLR